MNNFPKISLLFIFGVLFLLFSCETPEKEQTPFIEILSPVVNDVYLTTDTLKCDLNIKFASGGSSLKIVIVNQNSQIVAVLDDMRLVDEDYNYKNSFPLNDYNFIGGSYSFKVILVSNGRNYYAIVDIFIDKDEAGRNIINVVKYVNDRQYQVGYYGDNYRYSKYFDYFGSLTGVEFDNSVKQIYLNTGSFDGIKAYNYSTGELLHSIASEGISSLESFFTTMNFIPPTLYVGDKNPWAVKGYASNGMLFFSTLNSTIEPSSSEVVYSITETNDYVIFANQNRFINNSKLYAIYKYGYSYIDVFLCEQNPYLVSSINGTNNAIVFAKSRNDTYVMLYNPYQHKLEQLYILDDQTVSRVIKTDNIYIFATNRGVYRYVIGNTAPSLVAGIKSNNTLLARVDDTSFLVCDGYKFYLFGTLSSHLYDQWNSNDSIVAINSMIIR
ncbi:MAG: hypothetical protein PHP31_03995 [Lentimicrobiaceae bacterium]|nr:hypothetical protein [Lentimicrobiaceae bacterium]